MRFRLSIVLALQALAAIAPAQLPLPPAPQAGFTIERIASESAVRFPMFATFDERGRLFVAESSGGDLYAELSALDRKCRIRLLEDRDADGRFEISQVFAEQLVFPMGLAWREGKLFVADPPDLITLVDTNDDGRADQRQVLLTGFGHRDNGSLHGLIFGPDGWLYLTMGEPDGYRLRRADGTILEGNSGALLRCRPDGSDVTVLCRGFENLVEIIFTPGGEMIGTDNWFQRPVGGIRDALVHLVEGGLYPYARDTGTPQPITGPPLPPASLFPAVALSGLEIYRGSAFPASMKGQLFSAQHNSRKVGRHVLERQGATWRTEDFDFVTSADPDFHPSDVLEDADGSLVVVDTGSWYTHHCPTGRIRKSPAAGGLYRVRARHVEPNLDPWGLREDWGRQSSARQLELLADARPAVRDRARRALASAGDSILPALQAWLRSNTNHSARLHGVWVLSELSGPGAGRLLQTLLQDPEPEMAAAAARVLTVRPDPSAGTALQTLLAHAQPEVRLAAVQALARCGSRGSIPIQWQALTNVSDPFLAHGIIHAVHWLADAATLREALAWSHPRVQEAALLLLAQPPRPRDALQPQILFDHVHAEDLRLRQTAVELLRQRTEWASQIGDLLRRLPGQERGENSGRLAWPAWHELFLAFERTPSIQSVMAEALKSAAPERLGPLFATITRSALSRPPQAWVPSILSGLSHPDPEVRLQAARAAARWPLTEWSGPLRQLAENASEAVPLRLEAARAWMARPSAPTPAIFALLVGQLGSSNQPVLTIAAADVLARCQLSEVQLVQVFEALGDSKQVASSRFLRALQSSGSTADAQALVEMLERKVRAGWQPDEKDLELFLDRLPEAARRRAEPLRLALRPDLARQRARLDQFAALLENGRPQQGRAVFLSARSGCSVCHAVGSEGGRIGPDLTRIGAVRSGRDVLESILFPSATLAQGYEHYSVFGLDGTEWSGLLIEQSAESVLLREATGVERRFRREEIGELRRHSLSLMPEGLERGLTAEEFRDLLAFLQNLR